MPTWPDTPSIAVRAAEGGSASRPPGRWFPRPFTIRRSSRDTVTATPSAPSTRADTKAPAPWRPKNPYPTPERFSNSHELTDSVQGGFYFHPGDEDLSPETPEIKKPLSSCGFVV